MSLTVVFSELQEILTNYPSDVRDNVVSYLDEILDDTVDYRNILGLYEYQDNGMDQLKNKIALILTEQMSKMIKAFNIEMVNLIEGAEKDFKLQISSKKAKLRN